MYLTTEEAGAKFPEAYIDSGACIVTIVAKYIANIVPMPDSILIRIGCEIHSIDSWHTHGETLAKKHNESAWWQSHGKRILDFMIAESQEYQKTVAK